MKKNLITISLLSFIIFILPVTAIPPIKDKKQNLEGKEGVKKIVPAPTKAPSPPKPVEIKDNNLKKEINTKKLKLYIDHLITTGGDDVIIEFLKINCPKERLAKIIQHIIKAKKSNLNPEDKLHIIFALATFYKKDKKLQYKIFDLIPKNKAYFKKSPPLIVVAVKKNMFQIIPDIIAWDIKRTGKEKSEIHKKSLFHAAKTDNLSTLEAIHKYGKEIIAKKASKLLFALVKNNKGIEAISFLIKRGGNPNYEDPESKNTLLIQAIKNKNLKMVKQLVQSGASIKKASSDKSIGTPLQVARELNAVQIENFLREKGARDID